MNKSRTTTFAIIGFIANLISSSAVIAQSAAAPPVDARSIVEKADRIRFPSDGFEVQIKVSTLVDNTQKESRKFRVLSKGNDNTVVMITEPASERGQIILMKGRDLWVFMPDVSQPVRISLAQRLTGQVANGDLARANFGGDYNPMILRTDMIDGEKFWVIELTAIDRSVTYQKVIYWVNEKTSAPLKAEFYSLSNRLLKRCRYENYQKLAGNTRPTRLIMEDALRGNEQSVLEYSAMRLREIPDKMFTKEYLKKLE